MAAGKRIRLAFLMVLCHYAAMFAVGGAIALLLGLERDKVWDAPFAAFVAIIAVGVFEAYVVLHLVMRRWAKLTFREVGWRGLSARDVALGVVGFVIAASIILCVIAARKGGLGEAIDLVIGAITEHTPQQRVFFLLTGVFAALPEETIFRGILQPALQNKLGRAAGLVVGALIFAVYHFMFAWWQLLGKIAFGLVFGLLRERTGTLWAPAIAHGLTWAVLGAI